MDSNDLRFLASQARSCELFAEFYPDFRELCADFSKDIINRLPAGAKYDDDGILMAVLLSCLAKEVAHTLVVLRPNDSLHMLQRVFLATQAFLPEMQEALDEYIKQNGIQ